jgi:PAS domain S-box-containing protein
MNSLATEKQYILDSFFKNTQTPLLLIASDDSGNFSVQDSNTSFFKIFKIENGEVVNKEYNKLSFYKNSTAEIKRKLKYSLTQVLLNKNNHKIIVPINLSSRENKMRFVEIENVYSGGATPDNCHYIIQSITILDSEPATTKLEKSNSNLDRDTQLKERIKEQQAIIAITKLDELKLSEEILILKSIHELKKAFQYPDKTEISINHNEKEYASGKFSLKNTLKISSNTNYENQKLVISVYLISNNEKKSFLEEERNLINAAAKIIGLKLKQKRIIHEVTIKNNRLENIMSQSLDLICTVDIYGNFIQVSNAVTDILGYKPEEIEGKSIALFIHPEDLEKSVSYAKKIVEENISQTTEFENRYLTNNGEEVHLLWSLKWNPQEKISFAVAKNISERKKLEKLIHETTNAAKIASWEVLITENKVFWSPMMYEIFETDKDFNPNLDNSFDFFSPGENKITILKRVYEAIDNNENWDIEAEIITQKGNLKWIRSIGNVETRNGKSYRIYGSVQDITERKNVELRSINVSNNIPGVVFRYIQTEKGNHQVLYINEKTEELWGITPEMMSKNPEIVWGQVLDDDKKLLLDNFKKHSEEPEKFMCQWRMSHYLTNEIRWFEGYASPTHKANYQIIWDIVIFDITKRKKTELLLEQATKMSQIGGWEIDLVKNNQHAQIILTPTAQQILDANFQYYPKFCTGSGIFSPADEERIRIKLIELYKTKKPFDIECIIKTKTGEHKWIKIIANAEFNNNRCIRLHGSIQDIQWFKKVEQILNIAYNKIYDYKNALDLSTNLILINSEGLIIEANKNTQELSGYQQSEIIGKHFSIFSENFYPEDFYIKILDQLNQGEIWENEIKNISKSKEVFWTRTIIVPMISKNNLNVQQHIIIQFDITENKKNFELIQDANLKFRLVAEATNDILWEWDGVKDQFSWSRRYKEVFGDTVYLNSSSVEEVAKLVHPQDLSRLRANFDAALNNPSVTKWEHQYRQKNSAGRYVHLHDRAFIIRDESGKAVRLIGAMQDITEIKKYEQSLKKLNHSLQKKKKLLEFSNRELEQFAYSVTHDLQEPLRMVSCFLKLLENKYKTQLDKTGKTFIHHAVDGSERMKNIISDLLNYSLANKGSEEITEINLNEIIQEVIIFNTCLIKNTEAEINIGHLPTIKGKISPIKQIFQNLINNALKYQKQGIKPIIEIYAQENNKGWTIFIKDNGIGIDKKYQKTIFNPFERLHTQAEYAGSGIGLATVKKILDYMKEEILVESEIDKGSIFSFTLKKHV